MKGREYFNKFRFIISLVSSFWKIFPINFRKMLLVLVRNVTGNFGIVIRYTLLKSLAKSVGDNVGIFPMVILKNIENLEIGNNVSIHSFSYIDAMGGVKIGDNVSFGHGLSILAFEHNFFQIDTPIKEQGCSKRPIQIESNVYTGAKVTILGDVTVKTGTVIGANACVTKTFEKNVILGGVPAKIIKERLEDCKNPISNDNLR